MGEEKQDVTVMHVFRFGAKTDSKQSILECTVELIEWIFTYLCEINIGDLITLLHVLI